MRRLALLASTALLMGILPAPAAALEPECAPSEVRALVRTFIQAYNRGDVDYLDQIWAEEQDFFWYAVETDILRRGPLSEDRKTLSTYFRERSLRADQLRLRQLRVSWERGWHGAWDLTFELVRRSEDSAASGRYHGKGAATCQRLHAWAMGRDA